jgi:capsular polysaccharide transport system permease protein
MSFLDFFAHPGARRRRPRSGTVPAAAMGVVRWIDSVIFMVIHDFGDRYRQSKLSAFFTVFEPLGLITVLSLAQVVIGGGSLWQDALFHTTGILPYYLFFHVTLRIRASDVFRLPPRVTRFDQFLSHILSELIAKSAIGALMFLFFAAMKTPHAIPFDVGALVPPLLLLSVMGVGVGMINIFICHFFSGWSYIYAIAARAMMALSGVLIRPDIMPAQLKHFVVWDPLFQAITWFRSGCYPGYPLDLLHRDFLVYSVFAILGVGVLLDASLREARYTR